MKKVPKIVMNNRAEVKVNFDYLKLLKPSVCNYLVNQLRQSSWVL